MILRPTPEILRRLRRRAFLIAHRHRDPAFIAPKGATLALPTADTGLWAWYRGDAGVTKDGSNHLVSTTNAWADQTGNLRHLVAGNGGIWYCIWLATGVNGNPTIKMDKTVPGILSMATGHGNLTQPYSMVFLIKQNSWQSNGSICDTSTNGSLIGLVYQKTTTPWIAAYSGSGPIGFVTMTIGSWWILTVVFNGASSSVQLNNATAVTGDLGTGNPNQLVFAGSNNGAITVGDYELGGLIITTSTDSTNLTIHKNWLANYGGLTI